MTEIAQKPLEQKAGNHPSQRVNVLHVDDDLVNLQISKEILTSSLGGHFKIDLATSVEDAYLKLSQADYDVIVSDYQMPQKDGLQFLKDLREKNNDIPFILFTGKGREEVAIAAINLGADGYYNKQGDPETVFGELSHGIRLAAERRRTKKAFEESEEKFRTLFRTMLSGFVYFKGNNPLDFLCLEVNDAFEELTGLKKTQVLGKKLIEVLPNLLQDVPNLFEIYAKLVNGEVVHLEAYLKTLNRWLSFKIYSPKVNHFVVIFENITEQKNAREELQKINRNLKALAESNQALIHATDEAKYTKKVCDIVKDCGYVLVWVSFAELDENKTVRPFAYSGVKKEYLDDLNVIWSNMRGQGPTERAIQTGKTQITKITDSTFPPWRKEALKYGFSSSIALPLISERKILGTLNICNKEPTFAKEELKLLTELASDFAHGLTTLRLRKAKQFTDEKLKESNSKLETMNEKLRVVGGLARHDVANKLAAIQGTVHLARKKISADSEASEYLDKIDFSVEKIMKILNFTRAYEKIGSEKLTPVDVERSLQEAISLFPEIPNLEITTSCAAFQVMADSLFSVVLYNLIDNSLRHGKKVTKIQLRCETGLDSRRLIYEDNGVGITYLEKLKLFDEGHSTSGGTGYGLYLIRKIIEFYGWTISEDGEPYQGARFTIKMPHQINKVTPGVCSPEKTGSNVQQFEAPT